MNTRIALLCLSGKRPSLSLATGSDNSLHIMQIDYPSADIMALKELIESKLESYRKNDVTLYIDDPSGLLSQYGYRCSLDETDGNGNHALKQSLDRYFTLMGAGAITFPNKSHGFEIPPSMVNSRVKDSGENYYQIDWQSLEDNARACLLLIHCCFTMGMHQTAYVKALFEHLDDGDEGDQVSDFISGLIDHFNDTPIRQERLDLLNSGRNIL